MNITKQLLLTVSVLMLSFGGSSQILAASKNTNLPSSLSMAIGGGTVNAIYNDKRRSEIVISDQSFRISPTLAVRTIKGRMLGGLSVLRPGLKIAYKTASQKEKGRKGTYTYLVEAWVVPASFKFPKEWQ